MLSRVYGLSRSDIYGDATRPGLTVGELALYLEDLQRLMAASGEEGGGG